MDVIVNQYYKGFNDSVRIFGGVVDEIKDSKTIVRSIITSLSEDCDDSHGDWTDLYLRVEMNKEVIRLLSEM